MLRVTVEKRHRAGLVVAHDEAGESRHRVRTHAGREGLPLDLKSFAVVRFRA